MAEFESHMGEDDDELDENDPALEELGLSLAPKSQREKKKTRRKGPQSYPPEVQKLLGMANNAYVNRDYRQAVDLFQQVIVTHPNVFEAWNVMGVIQEELGNTEKALQLYLVAAHLVPKDGALWKKLAVISKDCGYNQQALYCFSRAYRADKNDMDALWDRSIMYHVLEQPFKAIQGFQKLLKVKQHYMPALEELVKIYSSLDQDHKRYREHMHQAMVDYEAAYLHYASLPDQFATANGDPFDVTDEIEGEGAGNEPFGYSALNMLSELYIMFEEYEKPIKMIKTWARRLQRRSHQTWWDDYRDDREFDTDPDDERLQAALDDNRTRGLPVDLRVKLGICRLMMEEVKEAKAQFRYLWRCSVEEFSDLYEEIAELYVNKQMWKEGYNVIRAMLQYDEMDVPKIWTMAGECLRHMGKLKEAKDYLEQAHRADPTGVDVSMMLAEVYEEMGNLPQALTLVNYVRQVNAERQSNSDKRRREARLAKRDMESGPSTTFDGSALLDDDASFNARHLKIAPHLKDEASWDAARKAMERIVEASRSRAAAERYSSVDRDRDIQLVKMLREHERAGKLAEREQNGAQELRDVIEKFNKIDLIAQAIDQKERSRVWDSRREAVLATREERTHYIQAARDLIIIFRNNRGFFPKEKNKPYMGVEARTWRYRRHVADADTVLSEHVTEMAERLGNAMGVVPSRAPVEEEVPEQRAFVPPPTTYKEVSFDAWYLLMIRQAVYLTYEDRYQEAAELLMVMFRANVCYSVARRRSGIMLVLLACAMWVGDYGAILNAGRYLANFGGTRPFPLRIYQAIYTLGPRNHRQFFAWVQNVTYKYLRRHVERMRVSLGKSAQKGMRKSHRARMSTRLVTKRGPNKKFDLVPRAMVSPNKRHKSGDNHAFEKPVAFPWRHIRGVVGQVVQQSDHSDDRSERREAGGVQGSDLQSAGSLDVEPGSFASQNHSSESTYRVSAMDGSFGSESTGIRLALGVTAANDSAFTTDMTKVDGDTQDVREDTAGPTAAVLARRRKRQLEGDDGAEAHGEDDDDDEGNPNEFDDEDEYDIDDDLYKTDEDEDGEGKNRESEDDGEAEWEQDGASYPGSRSKVFMKPGRRREDEDEDDDDEDDDGDDVSVNFSKLKRAGHAPQRKNARKKQPLQAGEGPGRRNYTKEVYPSFSVSMTMFLGHVLALSRSHVGSAAHFVECMDYIPTNPMIQFYVAIQFMNLAMQRTTPNRQTTLAQGLMFLQNYYRLRSAGYGTLAFVEREERNKAAGIAPYPLPIEPVHSVIGVVGKIGKTTAATEDWKAMAAKTSLDAISSSPLAAQAQATSTQKLDAANATAATSAQEPVSISVQEPTLSSGTDKDVGPSSAPAIIPSALDSGCKASEAKKELTSDASSAENTVHAGTAATSTPAESSSSTPTSPLKENTDPPLLLGKQEAEYNMARLFQQLGLDQLAMIHYRRVLELPSFRTVQRQLEAERQQLRHEEKAEGRRARAQARSILLEQRMKRAQETREHNEEQRAKAQEMGQAEMEEGVGELEEDGMDADGSGDENGVEETEEEEADVAKKGPDGLYSKIQLQGDEDEDPTDLRREAAFNLARIYFNSGAMGEGQLLMHKYCTF
ncbi:transcription factor TFIIIC subunit tfc4 [Dissophora globulifera]|uniref:Transcription factor TFIIIC subunit tfc4 n=1 Tax=Dissophora globulifera TaxID=979702 RepID=A0A9P6RSX3_9FUNG|nr:transcription factor TFIIIC subunit tfc4 [Dissophora globulifera]